MLSWKKYGAMLLVILMLSSISLFYPVQTEAVGPAFSVNAESAILVEASTGKILYEKNADIALPPASMSKMMAEYLVLEAIHKGQLSWDQVITTSEAAYFHARLNVASRVFLNIGEQRTVEELFTGMAVYSGNDATVALAEAVAGNEAAFVRLMNEKAQELGMRNTHFVNSTGMPNSLLGDFIPAGSAQDENLMSARDTAILAHALLNDYPEITQFSSIPEKRDYLNVNLINFNWMLVGHPQIDASPFAYAGLDGLKTGYTDRAKYCFTGTAVKGDMRLISVVMGAETIPDRFNQTRMLLDYGFNNFEFVEVVTAGSTLADVTVLPVAKGKEKEVGIIIDQSLKTVAHRDEKDKYALTWVPNEERMNADGQLVAPIEQGEVVGYAQLVYKGSLPTGYLHARDEHVEVVATANIDQAGWFSQFFRSIGGFFSGIWNSIVGGIKNWFS